MSDNRTPGQLVAETWANGPGEPSLEELVDSAIQRETAALKEQIASFERLEVEYLDTTHRLEERLALATETQEEIKL